jgi:predicted pyridoxine 5'-phosphate oxidase superfamily flavin-nucleotide-binding protein
MSAPARHRSAPWSAFHPGERVLQARVGVRERLAQAGPQIMRQFMPDQHRELFEKLPLLFVGSLDADGRPWASVLTGRPGFVHTPDAQTMAIHARPAYGDKLIANLAIGAPVGLLGIQLETRRRNRMNGTVTAIGADGFTITVDQSFGNCPQYIQARTPRFVADPTTVAAPRPMRQEGPLLSAAAAQLVAEADTVFIASAAQAARGCASAEGVDVSHRGGKPGFVRVTAEEGHTMLTAPDFRGNKFFNTLGNIAVNPRAGLLFVDFGSGGLLSLSGRAEVIWDGPDLAAFAGAERLLRVRVEQGVFIENAVPLRWTAPEFAPQLARTGSWE